jgi:hypothetical protein
MSTWYMAVAPYEKDRYGGDAIACSCLYPSKQELKRHCLLGKWRIVAVKLPDKRSDTSASTE